MGVWGKGLGVIGVMGEGESCVFCGLCELVFVYLSTVYLFLCGLCELVFVYLSTVYLFFVDYVSYVCLS